MHNMSSFRGFRKIILGVIRKWSSEAALNFEFYPSDWHFGLTQFTAVLISNTVKPRLFYWVVKTQGRPRPLSVKLEIWLQENYPMNYSGSEY